jgi:hypothetical protein
VRGSSSADLFVVERAMSLIGCHRHTPLHRSSESKSREWSQSSHTRGLLPSAGRPNTPTDQLTSRILHRRLDVAHGV